MPASETPDREGEHVCPEGRRLKDMGRNIPSVTCRIDRKISQWEKFAKLLSSRERDAFRELAAVARNRRSAIGEADEADIGVAILLAMVTNMKEEIRSLPDIESRR